MSEKAFKTIKDLPLEENYAPGHRACQGCGAALAARYLLKAAGKKSVIVNATGCLEVTSTLYPQTAWRVPWMHGAFENAGAIASGVEAAYKALMRKGKMPKKDVAVIAVGGDGGTVDIGLQALSGALERGHAFLYVCYDNEAYMNTGIQRSGATPFGASTTTSPPGKLSIGNVTWKKDVPGIVAAHRVPYVATASVAYPLDFMNKVVRGVEVKGPAYIHCQCPCPTGWRYDPALTIKVGRLAVLTGLWPLYEVRNGEFELTLRVAKRKPVGDYIKLQGRFGHLPSEEIGRIQKHADGIAEKLGLGPVG